jgi:hypothetical protein
MKKEKKVIIALYGDQNTGKTTTLHKLALELLESIAIEEDLQVVFSYEDEKIAISTGGDDKGVFEENTDLYKKKKGEKKEEEVNWKPDTFATPTRTDKINGLYSLLSFSEELQNGDKTTVLRKLSREFLKPIEEKEDIQISFRYKGRKIVISTAGDSESEVQASTDLFGMLDADILVTATRKIGGTDTCLSLRNYGEAIKLEAIELEAIWISKYGSESLNEAQAKELHAFIDLLIDNWDSEPKK